MLRKLNSISILLLAAAAFWMIPNLANAQQSVVNISKSNVKDKIEPAPTPTPKKVTGEAKTDIKQKMDKGWDGKVQGKQIVTPIEITFDNPEAYDNFAAGRQPINFILKNTASKQTITLDSKLLTEGFKPSADKSKITVYLVIDNLTTPVWDDKGCIETLTTAGNTEAGGANITVSYAACGTFPPVQNIPGGPIHGIIVKGGSNGGAQNLKGGPVQGVKVGLGKNPPGHSIFVMPGGSEAGENAAETLKLKINPSSNGVKRAENVIIISSSKGAGSPKAQGF